MALFVFLPLFLALCRSLSLSLALSSLCLRDIRGLGRGSGNVRTFLGACKRPKSPFWGGLRGEAAGNRQKEKPNLGGVEGLETQLWLVLEVCYQKAEFGGLATPRPLNPKPLNN